MVLTKQAGHTASLRDDTQRQGELSAGLDVWRLPPQPGIVNLP